MNREIIQALTPIILGLLGSTIAICAITNKVSDAAVWTAVGSALGGSSGIASSVNNINKRDDGN